MSTYIDSARLRAKLPEIILWFIVTVPVFFSGYFLNNTVQPLCAVAITLGWFLIIRDGKSIVFDRLTKMLGIIALLSVIFLPLSTYVFGSLSGTLWWIIIFATFAYTRVVIDSSDKLNSLAKAVVIGAAFVAIHATYFFIVIGLTSYPRLNSLFGLHNVYGGYLIIPLFLSLYLFISSKNSRAKALWASISILLFSNLILTFSRGTWLSIILAILIIGILTKNDLATRLKGKVKNLILGIVAVIALGSILSVAIWFAAKANTDTTVNQTIPNSSYIFSGETTENNAFTDRLMYWKDATIVVSQSPLFGVGIGNYGDAIHKYTPDTKYFASDPHNFYVKIFAEQGVIIGLLFVIMIITVVYRMTIAVRANKANSLQIILWTAILTSLIHIGMEVDWNSPIIAIILFVFVGSLISITKDGHNKTARSLKSLQPIIASILILMSLLSLWIFLAESAKRDGEFFLEKGKHAEALSAFNRSLKINPFDHETIDNMFILSISAHFN